MAGYKLYCLGNPGLEANGHPIKLETRKALALLIYLRLTGHEHSREAIEMLFWPEFSQRHAQGNLRRTLASLNKSLGATLIEADREKIELIEPGDIWLDVDEYQSEVTLWNNHPHPQDEICAECQDHLEKALMLYQGDFLEGFNLKDCPDFDDWQYLQREGIRQDLCLTLQRLVGLYAAQSLWKPALDCCLRWVKLDELNGAAQRNLIMLYDRAGQRNAAIRQFDEFARLLSEQLDQEPDRDTLELYERLKGQGKKQINPAPVESAIQSPLLKTKLYIPSPPVNRIRRDLLVHRLDEVERNALTILSAPAGYGKTTLLAEWINQASVLIAWYSLDKGDNDPYRFLAYTIAAFQSIIDEIGIEAEQLIHSPQVIPLHVILASLLNDLAMVQEPCVLVLDDYQFITEPAVHEVLAYILDHLPSCLHLLISSRVDPPLQLSRLRLNDQILEIRTKDVRFNSDEVTEFLNGVMQLGLLPDQITALETRTEGWVVGLKMAALSLQGRRDASEFIRAFSGSQRYVLDYLIEEVMKIQPTHVQSFLLMTSILERVSGPLCDAVLQPDWQSTGVRGQEILDYLEKSNLFVISQDENKQWFRYHHLFADLLYSRLMQTQPEKISLLHSRASAWYEKAGFVDDAIRHSLTARDIENAARLIKKYALSTLANGEMLTASGWINALSGQIEGYQPWIDIYKAWIRIMLGQTEGLSGILDRAEKLINHNAPDDRELLGNLNLARAELAIIDGAWHHAVALTQDVEALDIQKNGINSWGLPIISGDAHLVIGDLNMAGAAYSQAFNQSQKLGSLYLKLLSLDNMAFVYRYQGRLHEAEKVYQKAINLAIEQSGKHSIFLGGPLIGYSSVLYEWDDLDGALRHVEEGIWGAEQVGRANLLVQGYVQLAQLLQARGELDAAATAIDKAHQWMSSHAVPPSTSSMLACMQANHWLATNNMDEINNWLHVRRALEDTEMNFPFLLELVTLARAWMALEQIQPAIDLLTRMEATARANDINSLLIEIKLRQSLCLQTSGDLRTAMDCFEDCLRLAVEEGFLRTFIDAGEKCKRLVDEYHKQMSIGSRQPSSLINDYVEKIIAAFQ